MDSISDSMRAVLHASGSTRPPAHAPTARDLMPQRLITFRKDQRVREVIDALLSHRISGGPVVDEDGALVGIVSESDCLRVLSAGAYDGEDRGGQYTVEELMTKDVSTIAPDLDVYSIAHIFIEQRRRRLPVVDEAGQLIGQVSRRDVLRAVRSMLQAARPG